ncbi:MAG TPA: aminotransferase class IV [Gemmatimonadota bacterium]|nr:aminotransferase class IV [Gemmatimonadota bacterium]
MEVWVNGKYLPLDGPAVAARDRGFLHGEAVYEGVKIVARRPLFLDAHLERLAASARAIGLEPPWDAGGLRPILGRLLDDGAGRDTVMARLYLTRGVEDGPPSALAWLEPLPARSLPDTPPWRLACHPERIVPYLPAVKHTSRLAHARARRAARDAGADDALLVHPDGWVLEGAASNLFFFEADTLHTPEPGCGILAGITRDVVLELAPGCGFKTVEGRYPAAIVAAADECFLTFTSAGIKPVAELDGRPFPDPVPGPRTSRLREAYDAHVAKVLASTVAI